MDPTTNYYKTKRTLLLFAGALFLAVFAGFKIATADQRVTFLPFQLERPELLGAILLIAVVFYLFQLSLQWAAQSADIQKNRFHRIDFVATGAISSLSALCYLGSLVLPNIAGLLSTTPTLTSDVRRMAGYVAGLLVISVAALGFSKILQTFSSSFGRWLRGREASEEQNLMKLLTSKGWMLHYNPQSPSARKEIRFADDGRITLGSNDNEKSWRVRNGLLELLNSEGHVFSRFIYEPSSSKFIHTNDDDTLSIRSQYIFRAPGQS